MTKAERIKVKKLATLKRRKTQVPKVYQLKLQNLKAHQQEKLNRLFLEAKWFYNHIVADIDNRLTPEAWKLKVVSVKVGDQFEDRPLMILPAQCRQALRDRIYLSLKSLKAQKVKGCTVGALKPKKVLQRQLARKRKGSKNWHKTLMKLQREHEYIANCRRDCQNKVIAFPTCGVVVDRDLNAARNILRLGLSLNQPLPLDWREVTPVEWLTAVRILGSNPHIRISRHDEAGSRQGDLSEEVVYNRVVQSVP